MNKGISKLTGYASKLDFLFRLRVRVFWKWLVYRRAELISLTLQMTAAQIYRMTAKLPFIYPEFLYRLEIFFQQAQLAG